MFVNFSTISDAFHDINNHKNHHLIVKEKGVYKVVNRNSPLINQRISLSCILRSLFVEIKKKDRTESELKKALTIVGYFTEREAKSDSLFFKIKDFFFRTISWSQGYGFKTNKDIAIEIKQFLVGMKFSSDSLEKTLEVLKKDYEKTTQNIPKQIAECTEIFSQKQFEFTDEKIDVIIPSIEKDLPTLVHCIESIKKNPQIRRVIVVSDKKLTDQAEWFDEKKFPFTKVEIALWLMKGNMERTKEYLLSRKADTTSAGWYFQQLLKLYGSFTIPNISSNLLVLDSDTIFLNEVSFLNSKNGGVYSWGNEFHQPYFSHAHNLLPGFSKIFPNHSGVAHHMLFQRSVLKDLFGTVERLHQVPFWKAFCYYVDLNCVEKSGASEYEIYFNYVFLKTNQIELRPLKWENSFSFDQLEKFKKDGYDYISCHSWMRA